MRAKQLLTPDGLPCLMKADIHRGMAITHVRELLPPVPGKAVRGKILPSFPHMPANGL